MWVRKSSASRIPPGRAASNQGPVWVLRPPGRLCHGPPMGPAVVILCGLLFASSANAAGRSALTLQLQAKQQTTTTEHRSVIASLPMVATAVAILGGVTVMSLRGRSPATLSIKPEYNHGPGAALSLRY